MKANKIQLIKPNGQLDIYYMKTNKFKTNAAGLIFQTPLSEEYLVERSLLTNLLTKRTKKHPSEKDFYLYLKDLYDTAISSQMSPRGLVLNVGFFANIIDDKFLGPKVDLFPKALAILNDVITDPVTVDGFFEDEAIKQEKKLLIDDLKSMYNNKALYANMQLIKNMFKDEKYRLNLLGDPTLVEQVTKESLKAAYEKMLASSAIGFVIGDVDEEDIKKAFEPFGFVTGPEEFSYLDLETTNRTEIQELKEEQKIAQSTLCLGYRTDIRIGDPLYQAMRVFNGMFGKYFHSELYKEIREKHSLAYYINSEYASRKGALFITSGINKDSYNKVLTLISNVLAAFQAGDLDEENFELTKKAIINNMIEAYDQQTGLYRELLFFIEQKAERKSLEERIKEIESVTKEEVTACSKNLRLDTIFFLEGTNGDEEYA